MDITGCTKLTHCRFLNLFDLKYIDQTGKPNTWQMATRHKEPKCVTGNFDKPDAVVIVPYHVDKKIVIIKEFRVPLNDYEYGFPAGLVDEGETIEQAATRELFEETGLKVTKVGLVSPPIYSSVGLTDESISMVYVECEGELSDEHLEASEDITAQLYTQYEVQELLSGNHKFGAKAWIELSHFTNR